MSEMVERVARKVFEAANADPDWEDGYHDALEAMACEDRDLSQDECREIARAAIAAMREATEAMRDAGGKEWYRGAVASYQVMIDAALKE